MSHMQTVGTRLTVAMIVRNEESVLAESLASVRLIADEIVVLDTGSSDQTIAVARQWGAKTDTLPWQDDFSQARNHCWRLASGQWILWLDAGERLAPESAFDLRSFVDGHAEPRKVYLLLVEIPAQHSHQSTQQAAKVRLVPNRPELRFVGRVRETLQPAIESAGLVVDVAPGKIIRHHRQHDPLWRASRAQRDIRIASGELQQGTVRPARLLLALGEGHLTLGQLDRAVDSFCEAVSVASPGSTDMLEAYYGLLAAMGGCDELRNERLAVCLEALERFPQDAQLLFALGHCLHQTGQLELAARAFDAALRIGKVELEIWHPAELAETAALCLALTHSVQGHVDDARRVLEQAVGAFPHSDRLARHLLDIQIRQCDYRAALNTVHRLDAPSDEKQRLCIAVRGACRAAARQWDEALSDLQSAYLGGCKDTLVLRWLAAVLFQTGHSMAAEPVLADWQRIDPSDPQLHAYLSVLTTARQVQCTTAEKVVAQPSPASGVPVAAVGGILRIDPAEPVGQPTPIHLADQPNSVLPARQSDSAGAL